MTTVFVAQHSSPDGPADVIGVFTTLELAIAAGDAALDRRPYGCEIDIVRVIVDRDVEDAVWTIRSDREIQRFVFTDGGTLVARTEYRQGRKPAAASEPS